MSAFERVRVEIHQSADEAARHIAAKIAALIRARSGSGKAVVLGLATGSTPVPVYRELIRLHRDEQLTFANVVTFNLDEYYPLARSHRESYWRFMKSQLFDHIDIPETSIHLPNGETAREAAFEHCREYDREIERAGGIDIQLLGIGRTGHIGFNEPGSGPDSQTRLVTLNAVTREDAAKDFMGEGNVPRYAITMGVGTILKARRIFLMAWGRGKASVVARAVQDEPTDRLPASYLQRHSNALFVVDEAAASGLLRIKEPWRNGFVEWSPRLVQRAVIGLSKRSNKPILKLVDRDYNEGGLADLLTVKGSAYRLNIHAFNVLQHTITGWPGGKPGADDAVRPERQHPPVKRSLIIASEPLEDVLGMGGTMRRLHEQGHEVTVACATSGELAVSDREAIASLELVRELAQGRKVHEDFKQVDTLIAELQQKRLQDPDSAAVRAVKAAIREGEARQSTRVMGIPADRLEFLHLPFYGSGRYREFIVGDTDIEHMVALCRRVRPHQIFISGDQADPSSVSGLTFRIFREAFNRCKSDDSWTSDVYIWIFRGSNDALELDEIDMSVPLSPDELRCKIEAAYQHRSQHAHTPFALAEKNEAWQRMEAINRNYAREYDGLGMAEYEAMECFLRLDS